MSFNSVYYLNQLLEEIITKGVSDLHFQPTNTNLIIKERFHGQLIEKDKLTLEDYASLLNRIKVLAKLSDVSRDEALDSRIHFASGSLTRDIRVSLIPTLYGDSVVLRILNNRDAIPSLSALGMTPELIDQSQHLLQNRGGLILVTGATGSGKTTTLYSLLDHLKKQKPFSHIITIEDPVEYQSPDLTQIQVNDSQGFNFATILRAVLRHDPDIILIGEIRDHETAEIAIRAALTGHLVLGSMHTNNSQSTITRFIELGIKPFFLADTLLAVYSQQLIKITCQECNGTGCTNCHHSGYSGRTGQFDFYEVTKEEQDRIRGLTI